VALAAQVQALLRDRYAGFNDTHLTEKLREVHQLAVSRESVRRLRLALGRPAVHRRRPAQHRTRRPREAAAGQLLQLDGSPFPWLEGRGPALTLLGAIDDATSEVVALHFRPTEDLHGYATLRHQVVTTYGVPVALDGDGSNILVRTDQHWSLQEELTGQQAPTHLGRVLTSLGVGYVRAHSPQAKGRVERLWATLQDRLVSELRLRQLATADAANAFLPSFLADFNRRFTRTATAPRCGAGRPPISICCWAAAISAWSPAITLCAWARASSSSRPVLGGAPSPAVAWKSASCSMAASSSSMPIRSLPASGAGRRLRPRASSRPQRRPPPPHRAAECPTEYPRRPRRARSQYPGGPASGPSLAVPVFPPGPVSRTAHYSGMTFSCCSTHDIFIDRRQPLRADPRPCAR
jgi:hypothetical protein